MGFVNSPSVTTGGIRPKVGDSFRWWKADPSEVARALDTAARAIETYAWSQRYMMFNCVRLMTGRQAPTAYGLSMSQRSGRTATQMLSASFTPPALNVVATAADVYRNKTYKNRPFIQFLPADQSDYRIRESCRELTSFNDEIFNELRIWDLVEQCGMDAMTTGSAFIKIDDERRDGVWCLRATRVLQEEILLNGDEYGGYGNPRSLIQRVFMSREDAIDTYAKGEDAKKIESTIEHAEGVFQGFFKAPVAYGDIVPLVEGWRLPSTGGEPGRHVLAIGSMKLLDEKWTRNRFPFAKHTFEPLSNDFMGKGLAENLMPLQRKVDRLSAAIDESERRAAWPRFFVDRSAHINDAELAGPGIVHHSGVPPVESPGLGATPALYAERDNCIAKAFQRAGISANMAGGEKPEGLNSGVALLAFNQIDDSRHVSVAQRLEDFIEDISDLILEQAAETKPSVTVGGKKIRWNEVEIDTTKRRRRAFPMSRLPTLPAARDQQIQDWYDDGTIDRVTKTRLSIDFDTNGFADQFAATENLILWQLDTMVESGKYIPPSPYSDLRRCLSIGQARIQQEEIRGTDISRRMLLAQWLTAVSDMMGPGPQGPPVAMAQPGAPPQQTAGAGAAPTPSAIVGPGTQGT